VKSRNAEQWHYTGKIGSSHDFLNKHLGLSSRYATEENQIHGPVPIALQALCNLPTFGRSAGGFADAVILLVRE
jgi:hypothetical protein